MDITSYGITSVAAITVICLLVGTACKAIGKFDKFIPCIMGLVGGILGVVAFRIGMEGFPATDLLTAIAVGIVSGLAATGAHQIGKQLSQ